MENAIRFMLTNLPEILFLVALIIPTIRRTGPIGNRYLSWLLLLAIGVQGVWAGLFHIFFSATAAAAIGWQVSPFQFEIGVADTAMGVIGIVSFWRSLDFKAAVVIYVVLFNIGVTIGHIREAVIAADYSPDNFGMLLVLTVIQVPLLIGLLWKAEREQKNLAPSPAMAARGVN